MQIMVNGKEVDMNNPKDIKRALKTIYLIGFGFILFTVIIFAAVPTEQFSCYRSQDICHLQSRHLWETAYKNDKDIPLSSIKIASVGGRRENSGSQRKLMYSLKLQTSDGDIYPFSDSSSSDGTYQKRADLINSFLDSKQEELLVSDSFLWLKFLLSAGLFTIGFIFVTLVPRKLKRRLRELENGL